MKQEQNSELQRAMQPMRTPMLDAVKRLQERSSELQRVMQPMRTPMLDAVKRLQERSSELQRVMQPMRTPMLDAVKRLQERSSELQRVMQPMRTPMLDAVKRLQERSSELQRVMQPMRTPMLDAVKRLQERNSELQRAMQPMRTPMLDIESRLAETRIRSALPNIEKRSRLPEIAEETKGSPPPLIYAYNFEIETQEDEQGSAFKRNKTAYDLLQRFETQLRRFIDEKMKVGFGANWIKHQVSDEIRKQWLEKKQKARDNGEPEQPLIAYADFTDYVQIITRKDNWEKVFKPTFKRSTFVQESLQRLYPIRVCTMHARPITQDEELYLYVEVKRILNAIRIVI